MTSKLLIVLVWALFIAQTCSTLNSAELTPVNFKLKTELSKTDHLELLYASNFHDASELNNWIMDGSGKAELLNGALSLQSQQHEYAQALIGKKLISGHNRAREFGSYLKDIHHLHYQAPVHEFMVMDRQRKVEVYRGGHFNYWLNRKFPDGVLISYDFKASVPQALHMIIFGALGLNGESIFDPKLKKETRFS
jgi:hypothetical protein